MIAHRKKEALKKRTRPKGYGKEIRYRTRVFGKTSKTNYGSAD